MISAVEILLFSWLFIGGVALLCGFNGLLMRLDFLLLLFPIFFLAKVIFPDAKKLQNNSLSSTSKILLFFLLLIWLIAATGLFVPETGFDAVWYHLPVVSAFVKQGGYFYLPNYYQSLNPFFSDGIFLIGYEGMGQIGTKIVAYLFALSTLAISYVLARSFLSKRWSLLFLLTISTFQVMTWQSTSFYVDIAKTFWDLVAVYFLFKAHDQKTNGGYLKSIFISGLFLGASLGTKMFSILLWPVFWLVIWLQIFYKQKINQKKLWQNFIVSMVLFAASSLVFSLPFYFFAYQHTANPFYSLQLHTDKLAEIGGSASLPVYLWQRTLLLPSSLTELTLFSHDYTTLLFLVFAIFFFIYRKSIWQNLNLRLLSIFTLGQWLVWWYVPPLSTRYALSGFITLTIILFFCLRKYVAEKPAAHKYVVAAILLAVWINLLPRLIVLKRNLTYIFGFQTQSQYLHQFYDGSIDQNLKNWYHLSN